MAFFPLVYKLCCISCVLIFTVGRVRAWINMSVDVPVRTHISTDDDSSGSCKKTRGKREEGKSP